MQYEIVETAWGSFGLVTRERKLLATYLPACTRDVRSAVRRDWPAATEGRDLLPRFSSQVQDYFDGKQPRFTVTMDLENMPPFRRAVLEACRRIPYGKTASYQDLARSAGSPGAARAVGGAMAKNPVPLVVPCHRVLRSDGSIGGFSSPKGVEEKMCLLQLEGVQLQDQQAKVSTERTQPSQRPKTSRECAAGESAEQSLERENGNRRRRRKTVGV